MARKAPTRKPAKARAGEGSASARVAAPAEPLLQLSGIVGQAPAVEKLRTAQRLSRLPHALLFHGPAGVGKRTTAIALAAAILCEKAGPGEDACGRCQDCRLLEAGTHPDFHLIYKELAAFHDDPAVRDRKMQELSIDVVRGFLIAAAAGRSAHGRGKVFIVRDAETMSDSAQNALLKTLEEPPPKVTIILLAERPEELLPTTLSRCALVRFAPLPADFVSSRLAAAGVEAGEARFWASLAGGSVGAAMRLAKEDGLYAAKRTLLEKVAALGGGGNLSDALGKTTEKLAASAIEQAKADYGVDLSARLATRRGAAVVLQLLASACRDALRIRCAAQTQAGADGTPPISIVNADQTAEVQAIARRFRPEQLADVLEQLAEYETLLWRNVNPKTIWDNVAITLAAATPLAV
jgi:DNA polymerase III subunit delta'